MKLLKKLFCLCLVMMLAMLCRIDISKVSVKAMNNEKKEYVVLTRTKTETNELMEKNYKNLNKANDYIVSAELTEEQCVELENDENIK